MKISPDAARAALTGQVDNEWQTVEGKAKVAKVKTTLLLTFGGRRPGGFPGTNRAPWHSGFL